MKKCVIALEESLFQKNNNLFIKSQLVCFKYHGYLKHMIKRFHIKFNLVYGARIIVEC